VLEEFLPLLCDTILKYVEGEGEKTGDTNRDCSILYISLKPGWYTGPEYFSIAWVFMEIIVL
jgi:hypothetical protein